MRKCRKRKHGLLQVCMHKIGKIHQNNNNIFADTIYILGAASIIGTHTYRNLRKHA